MIYEIDFCDFWDGFDKEDNYFINVLRKIYGNKNVVISDKPEFLFFSCFGFRNLKYNCLKIFFTGENLIPDFNICDYAIGMHEIHFEDRYFRLPFYMLYSEACKKALLRNNGQGNSEMKQKFCCYVISNSLGAPQRKEMIDLLSSYKQVDSGGRYQNNVGGPIKNKLKFISDYKFNLCFENSASVGYTTEKIVEGFAGGGIPIYWGNPKIAEEFNENAFVNCNDFKGLNDVLDYIKYLDTDDNAYMHMMQEPIFTANQNSFNEIQDKFEDYIRHIFQLKKKRMNNIYVGRKYTERMKFFMPWFELYRFGERGIGFFINMKRRNKD